MEKARILAFLAALMAATPVFASPLDGKEAGEFLSLHNAAREAERLPKLEWSKELSEQADEWARQLARDGKLHHSSWADREGTGENLWMGTAGFYSHSHMMGAFTGEKRDFRPGTFPDVSATGRWEDVAHYTQIIWPDTRKVGCALATARGRDVLVCRYWPAGNWFGSKVGR